MQQYGSTKENCNEEDIYLSKHMLYSPDHGRL